MEASVLPTRRRPGPAPWAVVAVALLLLGIAMAAVGIPFRNQLREQLAQRDARVLAALIQRQLDDPDAPDAGDDPLVAIIAASMVPDLPGVEAVQVYSPEGRLFATLLGPTNTASPPATFSPGSTAPFVRFNPGSNPRLELWLPLQPASAPEKIGYTFLSLDGRDLATEYDRLDASLQSQMWLAFLVIGGLLASFLILNLRSLQRSNRLLADRSLRLEQANRELSLAARTSAVGAVASHLVHGLRNPLAALQQAVAEGGDSRDAAPSAQRMRRMIDEVVRVLRDEQGLDGFEIPADELMGEAERRGRSHAPAGRRLRWERAAADGPLLDNRTANLTLLVLENLATNAAQALPDDGRIRFSAQPVGNQWHFEVDDDGPGIPPDSRDRLFTPLNSSKPGGSGLGLALSRQLARHLGGDLCLIHSEPGRTRFQLTVPFREGDPRTGVCPSDPPFVSSGPPA